MYRTEQQEAESFAAWLRVKGYDFTHIPNETGHSDSDKRRAVRMKRAGTSPGFPDYVIFAKSNSGKLKRIAIELKRVKEAKPSVSKNQRDWLAVMAQYDFDCAICYGRDEAVEFVEEVLNK